MRCSPFSLTICGDVERQHRLKDLQGRRRFSRYASGVRIEWPPIAVLLSCVFLCWCTLSSSRRVSLPLASSPLITSFALQSTPCANHLRYSSRSRSRYFRTKTRKIPPVPFAFKYTLDNWAALSETRFDISARVRGQQIFLVGQPNPKLRPELTQFVHAPRHDPLLLHFSSRRRFDISQLAVRRTCFFISLWSRFAYVLGESRFAQVCQPTITIANLAQIMFELVHPPVRFSRLDVLSTCRWKQTQKIHDKPAIISTNWCTCRCQQLQNVFSAFQHTFVWSSLW